MKGWRGDGEQEQCNCQSILFLFRPEEICVGFNGGKDCTAILHITHAVFHK